MKTQFDPDTLSSADRLTYRMQTVRYWEERLASRQARIKRIQRTNTSCRVLHAEAVEQAQHTCVMMDTVGVPLWKN